MISSILIPTDFSPASWKATQFGLDLLRFNENARISILHIYPSSNGNGKSRSNGNGKVLHSTQPQMDQVKERMNKLTRDLTEKYEIIDNMVLSGNVEEVLTDFVKENEFDLVIVGVNSNGVNNEIGSHTVSMIEKSGVPVMIVPNSPSPYGAIAS